MKRSLHDLGEQYTAALQDYLGGSGEAALARAYELGRRALSEGLGVLEMVALYEDALETFLVSTPTANERGPRLKAAAEFFAESLTPFEMAHRGIQWAHARLIQMNEELREVNGKLEAFSYAVSHDLRAPLRHVKGFAQALLDEYADRLDGTAKDYAYRIVTGAGRMDDLIQDLLTYSRLSAGQFQLRPISLGSLVTEIVSDMAAELRRLEARVIVESPLFDVLGHPVALEQVLVNLLSNAVKFVRSGVQPKVWISAEERGDRVRLWVKDNGIGIPKDKEKSIFGLFQRANPNRSYPGTGLGLAIVSRAVGQMGGRVGVESSPEKGSTFWVELRKVTSQDNLER